MRQVIIYILSTILFLVFGFGIIYVMTKIPELWFVWILLGILLFIGYKICIILSVEPDYVII